MTSLPPDFILQLKKCKAASKALRSASLVSRNGTLQSLLDLLLLNSKKIIDANKKDLVALPKETPSSFRDRLELTDKQISQMIVSIKQILNEPDPIHGVIRETLLMNGLKLRQIPSPLGVILMIFESRPNVAIEAFSLAIKSGNALILRGGKECQATLSCLYNLILKSLEQNNLLRDCVWGITDPNRDHVQGLLQEHQWIDVVVPRGGNKLIDFVVANSKIPIIKNDRGMCHVYVHEDADLEMALAIVENAKTQRPGVCNAMETVLVHRKIFDLFVPALYKRLVPKNVEWFGCPKTQSVLKGLPLVSLATPENWDSEYLDFKLNCKEVSSLEIAMEHIEQHGSHHSESIITSSEATARKFQTEIDAAAVYWNASTRFTDGFEFGLGGELGISTQKLHVRGPVGLRELTSLRWVIDGSGQIRR